MGVGWDEYPKQSSYVGAEIKVYFNDDFTLVTSGTVLRDDAEDPGNTIIQLNDGRVVLGSECNPHIYHVIQGSKSKPAPKEYSLEVAVTALGGSLEEARDNVISLLFSDEAEKQKEKLGIIDIAVYEE